MKIDVSTGIEEITKHNRDSISSTLAEQLDEKIV